VIFPVFYLSLLMEELRGGGQTIAVVLLAAALALALVPLTAPGIPVIASCAVAFLGLRGRSS
jgi:predicted branched-subunit amino acid permease